MLQIQNNAGLSGVLEMLSYIGACVAFADKGGRIIGSTPGFTEILGNGDHGGALTEIFAGLPLPLSANVDHDFELTVRESGRTIFGRTLPIDLESDVVALVLSDGAKGLVAPSQGNEVPAIHSGNDLIFQFDSSGKVYYVSGNVEMITGYPADEFTSGRLRPLDIVHPEDKARLEEAFIELITSRRNVGNYEHRIVRKNGETAYLLKSWYALFDTDGKFSGIMSVNKDITKEKELRERLQLFHSAFEHSTDAIIITGIDGKILDVNDAFTNIYGYSREESLGKSTALVQSKHSTPEFYQEMWKSLNGENQWRGEILNRKKDGTEIPVWLSITPIYLGEKKIGYMGIESDMSERKNLEQQIIQTEKLATIGQLATGVAHEIGTPLNIISGNAEYILLDMKKSDQGYRELEIIIEQTKRMSMLMRQLLDFARPKVLSLKTTDPNRLISEVLSFIRVQFKRKEIKIVTRFRKDIPSVYCDPALLYQVFLNIIVNAFQAMTKGGALTISTGRTGEDGRNQRVKIEIADTGEGISPEHLRKIFVPFFTTKEPGKGTGLGLAVTKRIVEEHKGTIDIKSEQGKGTVVTILFPPFRQNKQDSTKI